MGGAGRSSSGSPRFWRTLATCATHVGVRAEWEEWLGEEIALAEPFLQLVPGNAESYPCPSPGGDYCPRRVIAHASRFRAVCGNRPADCEELTLVKRDVAIRRFNLRKIARQLAASLGIDDAKCAPVESLETLLELGTLSAGQSVRVTAYLGLEAAAAERALDRMLARIPTDSFVLLLPEGGAPSFRLRAQARRGAVLECAEQIDLVEGGVMEARFDRPRWLGRHAGVLGIERRRVRKASRRGPRTRYSSAKDEKLLADWKGSGMRKAEFEAARGLASGDVDRARSRVKSRRMREE